MKKIEVKTPKYETVQVGEDVEIKWETSDGIQYPDEKSAEHHEFYCCKVKQRGLFLPTEGATILDCSCQEDLARYEKDYMYNRHIKKYNREELVYPNTFVMYHVHDPDWVCSNADDEDYDYYYDQPDTHVHVITLEKYKELLLDSINKLS